MILFLVVLFFEGVVLSVRLLYVMWVLEIVEVGYGVDLIVL